MSGIAKRDPNTALAQLAVETNVLSRQQSEDALNSWRTQGGGRDFGMYLVASKLLTSTTLWGLLQARDQGPGAASVSDEDHSSQPTETPEPDSAEPARVRPSSASAERPFDPEPELIHTKTTAPEPASVGLPVDDTQSQQAAVKGDGILLEISNQTALSDLLQQAMEMEASDLHLHSGAPVMLRLGGDIRPASAAALSNAECVRLVHQVLSEDQKKSLQTDLQLDFAFELSGVGRFRANAYQQQRGLDAVFRTIPPTPPTLKELGMPPELQRMAEYHQGLVLFTGPAGCGKSSTMAALVRLINESRPDHILTIEDPVEHVHVSASCNVNQREVGDQTESFSRALRAALREDPDVIVIGELRDLETVSLAITAAETGHLVLGTLHTSNSIRTVNRLLSVFPPEQQAQIRVMLSESLKAVVSQRLVRRADGKGRVPAVEVMINTSAIGNLIRENRTFQIRSAMQTGSAQGQRLLDAALVALVKDRVITKEEAFRHAEDQRPFE